MLLLPLATSIMLLVTKVHHLMMQESSTAHMYLCRWYVQLERTPSSPRLASRPDMVWLLTHLLKAPPRVWVDCRSMLTATTEELLLRTSCDTGYIPSQIRPPSGGLFLCIQINSQKGYDK